MAWAAVLQMDAGPAPVVRGADAPGFELPGLGATAEVPGATVSLDALAGRVVLVNFWATWCEPCTREMPAMERLYAALPRQAFELVAVSIDDEAGLVRAFRDEHQLSFPIVLDVDQSVYQAYQTMGVPESLVVDREGRIVERYVGPREWDAPEYVARILAVIEGADVSAAGS